MKGAGRRREQMDKMAAAVMLQSYLDAHRQA
jgi:RNase H-fold protein (predicted Holliday junction resolvase)